MTDSIEELIAVRKLLQEAVARAEKAELERDEFAALWTLLRGDVATIRAELEEARRELSRIRASEHPTHTGGL